MSAVPLPKKRSLFLILFIKNRSDFFFTNLDFLIYKTDLIFFAYKPKITFSFYFAPKQI